MNISINGTFFCMTMPNACFPSLKALSKFSVKQSTLFISHKIVSVVQTWNVRLSSFPFQMRRHIYNGYKIIYLRVENHISLFVVTHYRQTTTASFGMFQRNSQILQSANQQGLRLGYRPPPPWIVRCSAAILSARMWVEFRPLLRKTSTNSRLAMNIDHSSTHTPSLCLPKFRNL